MSEKETQFNRKELLKFLLKLLVSGVALYFVFKKIDFEKTWATMLSANLWWILAAVLAFNVSKLISTLRVKYFLDAIGLHITHGYNVQLYYIGAFYNLFLPGSIGGDGYKVYLLTQRFQSRTKQLIQTVFLDRLSGLVALFILTCILVFLTHYPQELILKYTWLKAAIIAAAVLAYPVYYMAVVFIMKPFAKAVMKTNVVSLVSQLLQIATAFLILISLSVTGNYYDYLALFMIASVVAIFPFTIGGLGARELVLSYGSLYLPIDDHTAVAFALLFFAVTAVSSFIGLFLNFKSN